MTSSSSSSPIQTIQLTSSPTSVCTTTPLSSPSLSFCERLDLLPTTKTIFQLLVCIILPIIFVYNIELQSTLRQSGIVSKTMPSSLPPPHQTWVHAVDSRKRLLAALQDDNITAIETDLLMGTTSKDSSNIIPIMAHPPSNRSDLSMMDFLHLASNSSKFEKPTITKVIKLDFKELDTVQPTLQAIADLQLETSGDNGAIILNADILPGPGKREPGVVSIGAQIFLETCLPIITQSAGRARIAFSLGYKTDCKDMNGYTQEDVQAMANIISEYKLVEKEIGVILALNARQLAKSLPEFDTLLESFPQVQILAWTGKGEPPIPKPLFHSIQDHYANNDNMSQRIGYDCQMTGNRFVGKSIELGLSSLAFVKSAWSC